MHHCNFVLVAGVVAATISEIKLSASSRETLRSLNYYCRRTRELSARNTYQSFVESNVQPMHAHAIWILINLVHTYGHTNEM